MVNEETSLWLCFFYDRSEALDSLRRDEDLHIDNCIVKQIICIREIFRVRCTKHNTKKIEYRICLVIQKELKYWSRKKPKAKYGSYKIEKRSS